MSDFSQQVRAFSERVTTRNREMFVRVVQLASESIVTGSAITGAPGQPVGQYGPGYHRGSVGGTLKASWHTAFESPTSAVIGSGGPAAAYNRQIEDGVGPHGPLTLRSTIGGFHSVALTRAGFGRIVEAAAAEVAR